MFKFKFAGKYYHLYELGLLVYVFFIPIEDFFLQDLIGSSSRIAGGVMIILFLNSKATLKWKIISSLFYLYFLWAGASILFWANSPDYYSIFRLFMWMITTVVVASITYRNLLLIPLVFKTYILSSLYLVFLAIVNFIANSEFGISRVDVEGMDQNLLAAQFLICVVCLFYWYFRSNVTLKSKVFISALIFLFILGIIASGSRSALLSALVSFLIISPKNYLKLSNLFQISIFIIAGFLFLKSGNSFTKLLGERIEAAENDKGSNRIIIWKVAKTMIDENPLIGVGYRNFRTEFSNYIAEAPLSYEEMLRWGDKSKTGTHNAVLEVLSELGLIGLFLFYGFQYILIKNLKNKGTVYGHLIIYILIALNFNYLFLDISNLKYFWLIVGLGFAIVPFRTSYSNLNKKSLNSFFI